MSVLDGNGYTIGCFNFQFLIN
uniref:Uncharacterized protein n=1 Tax=Rhizophora mucronata TaxID=61149 RepID=A0A2P2J783_RHIMU